MRLVVADTSPIRYLVRIGQIHLLPSLFEKIFLPSVVADELRHPSAPPAVRDWMRQPPGWLEVMPVADIDDPALDALDRGELGVVGVLNARGQVRHDDQRLCRGRGLELETGERGGEQHHDQGAEPERGPRVTRRQGWRKTHPDDRDRRQRHESRPQEEGAGEIKAHGGKPATRARPDRVRQARSRARSRAGRGGPR